MTKTPIKFPSLERACQYCQVHDGSKVYAYMLEYHPATPDLSQTAYWTVKIKVPVPLGMGKLHWIKVVKE